MTTRDDNNDDGDDGTTGLGKFPGDVVAKFTPTSFSLAFVHAMRKRRDLTHVPSVRTSVALPRFLAARWFRTRTLTPKDYVEAAVLLTPLEDQGAAFEVARKLLFPKEALPGDTASASSGPALEPLGAPVVVKTGDAGGAANDDGPSILADLAEMNLDLANLDLGALDAALDQKVQEATELKSLDLMTELSTSGDPADKSLAQLATEFGGAAELEAQEIRDEPSLRKLLLERLFAKLGELGPETAVQAARAGFTAALIDDVEKPWEKAALLAANDDVEESAAASTASAPGTAPAVGPGTSPASAPGTPPPAAPAAPAAPHPSTPPGTASGTPPAKESTRAQLDALVDGVMNGGDAREIGKTLRYLRAAAPAKRVEPFRKRALSSARHLADWAEIVEGLGSFEEPPEDLVAASARENLPRTLMAAGALEHAFAAAAEAACAVDGDEASGHEADDDETLDFDDANAREPPPPRRDLRHTAFGAWAAALTETPSLDFLLDVYVPVEHWAKLARLAFADTSAELDAATKLDVDARMQLITQAIGLGPRLRATKSNEAREIAAMLATKALVVVNDRRRFLPLLDALVDAHLMPHDGNAVVAAGVALGIEEDEILARLGQPLEQLRFLIEGNVQDLKRHLDLVDKIDHIPEELLDHLVACVVRDKNMMGLALLLAIALGPTLERLPPAEREALVDDALLFKGIGGGENLLLQWYHHRDTLPPDFKERIKALARQALIDAAMPWMQKGVGGAERGLMPQARTRPYRAGDELDLLDVEGTLEMLATSGKQLDQMGSDDLVVMDTSAGRAGFAVLIDISGSMSGKDLAVCAIAVVMLLGRLKPEEIALALFESNTHVIKGFDDHRDLDDVANELLELRATGGTRVDTALRYMRDQLAAQTEAEQRILFLLSDFCFFEDKKELVPLLEGLAALDVRFLGAAHGHFDKGNGELFVDVLGGQITKLASITKLPDVLLQALAWIGDGAQ